MTRAQSSEGSLRITQVRSRIGNQGRIVRVLVDGLGLGKIGAQVERPDNAYTRGMIAKVSHMVRVEEIEGQATVKKKAPAKKPAAKKAPAKRTAEKPTAAAAKADSAKKPTEKAATAKDEKAPAKDEKSAAKAEKPAAKAEKPAAKTAAKSASKATTKKATAKKASKDESGSAPDPTKAKGGKEAEE